VPGANCDISVPPNQATINLQKRTNQGGERGEELEEKRRKKGREEKKMKKKMKKMMMKKRRAMTFRK